MIAHQQSQLQHLPPDWGSDRLKDVVTLRDEKLRPQSDTRDYLELEDIESGTGRILSRRDTLDVGSSVTRFYKGDILFGKLRPYLEKYCRPDFDGNCTGEILALRPDRIHGSFLFYCLASRWFIERCNALAYGAKMPRVDWATQLAQFELPLPPLVEQKRIAAFLDRSCEDIDRAIAKKRQQLALLDGIYETTIERAVTHGLDRRVRLAEVRQDWIVSLPAHWQAVRIKRLVSRIDYGISQSTERDGRFPVLKMGNIHGGEIRFANIEFVEDVEQDLILQTDDILYNRTNSADQVGKAAIFRGSKDDGVTFASYLVRLRVNHRILPSFLNYVVNSAGFLSFARKLAIPSVQQSNLNSTRYGRIFVPLPPLDEQHEICDHLDDKLAHLREIAGCVSRQIDVLTEYRKSLIHEYVTGQRRVPGERVEKVASYG